MFTRHAIQYNELSNLFTDSSHREWALWTFTHKQPKVK